jgi:putative redox protein
MSFDIELQGHHFSVDADDSVGGKDRGPRPKALLLSALAGCTGMDVVAILGKMQMPYDRFEISVAGDTRDEHPKVYTDVKVIYSFWGEELDEGKIRKAVTLSQEKYCGVIATLKNTGTVSYEIVLNP